MPIFIPPIAIHYMKKANIYPKNRGLGWIVDLSKFYYKLKNK